MREAIAWNQVCEGIVVEKTRVINEVYIKIRGLVLRHIVLVEAPSINHERNLTVLRDVLSVDCEYPILHQIIL